MTHPTEEEMVLLYYRELEDDAVLREHLDECEACRRAYAGLAASLDSIAAPEAPERAENYGALLWQRLRPRMAAEPKPSFWRWLFAPPRWAAAGAVAVLVMAAFFAGRFWPAHPSVATGAKVRERILLVAVGDHLDRSQMVLLELVNSRPEPEMDIAAERQRAQDLVAANRLYRQAALRDGDARVASVLDDLERTLLEIAHSPARLSSAEFEELRQRVEAQGILFKVRVIDSQVRRKAAQPSAPANPRRSS
jgi:hypothetical protein